MRIGQGGLTRHDFGEGFVIQCFQILAYGTVAKCWVRPVDCFTGLHAVLMARVSRDQAGVYGEAFTLDQACSHAAADHLVEHPAEGLTGTEATMAILGEGGVIRNRIFQAEATEPAVGEVEMDFFAQASLGADAIAVTNDQHADHELRIDRGTSGVAVVIRQVLAQFTQVKAAVHAAEEMILGNVFVEVEGVKQLVLTARSTSHHHSAPRVTDDGKHS